MNQIQIEKYKKDLKDYILIKQINSGASGIVYEVKNIKTNETYAAKVIHYSNDDQYKETINREIGIMMRVVHPTLIGFQGFSLVDFNGIPNITILMDYIELGSLSDVLDKFQHSLLEKVYDNTSRQIILVGIAYGMMQLHQRHVIHRDLKPENILIDSNYFPHISDFGYSKIYEIGHTLSQSKTCGTMIYMAPEVLKGAPYDGKADVYSFSIIMFQVLTDTFPYPLVKAMKMTEYQFQINVVEKNYRPEFPEDITIKESLVNLVKMCWSPDPKERPTFEEIFNKLAYSKDFSIYDMIENDQTDEKKYFLDDIDESALESYIEDISNSDHKIDQNEKELIDKIKEYKNIIQEKENRIKELEKQNKDNQENGKINEQLEEKNKKIQEQNKTIEEKEKYIQQLEEQNKKLLLQIQNQQNTQNQQNQSQQNTQNQSQQNTQNQSQQNTQNHSQQNNTNSNNSNEITKSESESNQQKKFIAETKITTKEPVHCKIHQNQPKQVESNQPKAQSQRKPVQQTKTTTAFDSSQSKLQAKNVVNQPKKVSKPAPATTSSLKSATLIKPSVSTGVMQSSKFANTGPFTKASVVKTTKKKTGFGLFEEAHQDVIDLMDEYTNLE